MTKRTTSTSISPLPRSVSRDLAVALLHNHGFMLDLNPLVSERQPIRPPPHATREELGPACRWYAFTERKTSYLPAGTYTCVFHNLPRGVESHCYGPTGFDTRQKWTIDGSLPGEPLEPLELGLAAKGAPASGLYVREDVDMRCSLAATFSAKRMLKNAHAGLVVKIRVASAARNFSPSSVYSMASTATGSVGSSSSSSWRTAKGGHDLGLGSIASAAMTPVSAPATVMAEKSLPLLGPPPDPTIFRLLHPCAVSQTGPGRLSPASSPDPSLKSLPPYPISRFYSLPSSSSSLPLYKAATCTPLHPSPEPSRLVSPLDGRSGAGGLDLDAHLRSDYVSPLDRVQDPLYGLIPAPLKPRLHISQDTRAQNAQACHGQATSACPWAGAIQQALEDVIATLPSDPKHYCRQELELELGRRRAVERFTREQERIQWDESKKRTRPEPESHAVRRVRSRSPPRPRPDKLSVSGLKQQPRPATSSHAAAAAAAAPPTYAHPDYPQMNPYSNSAESNPLAGLSPRSSVVWDDIAVGAAMAMMGC